jgi:hypothetical protein
MRERKVASRDQVPHRIPLAPTFRGAVVTGCLRRITTSRGLSRGVAAERSDHAAAIRSEDRARGQRGGGRSATLRARPREAERAVFTGLSESVFAWPLKRGAIPAE